jgi:Helicase conserved C-terminal domain
MSQPSPYSTSQGAPDLRSEPSRESSGIRGDSPRDAFRRALFRYSGPQIAAIIRARGQRAVVDFSRQHSDVDQITEYLDRPSHVQSLTAQLTGAARLAISLLAVTDTTSVSLAGLTSALSVLTADSAPAIANLLELGLLVIDLDAVMGLVRDFTFYVQYPYVQPVRLLAHPEVVKGVRAIQPGVTIPRASGPVSQIREADGLEPILRLAALWQRVGAEPLRQTMQGTLYKRDRDRLADDPVLSGAPADELKGIPQLPALWLDLAQRIGLVIPELGGERLLAAPTDFWTDNAVHLPQMIATAWMALDSWSELEVPAAEKGAWLSVLPPLRTALMLLLSTLDESEWVAIEDLAEHLARQSPHWASPVLPMQAGESADSPRSFGAARGGARSRTSADPASRGAKVLESVVLGAAYPLGLVRTAQQQGSKNRLVQLTPLGRYVLALGPTPPPRDTFDQFLFVQPNFEMIAYRQGLTPQLVGHLSRFAWSAQIGSALELKLTRESIVHGLNGGLSPESILGTLTRHSQRALPAGVINAVNDWASRRERVTFYASATLVEFSSQPDRDAALAWWPDGGEAAPLAIGERFLLVEDERTIPFERLRLSSSRDYRRPPDVCVTVEPDGVTLALDPARSDLLVDAELARFADELSELDTNRGRGRGPGPAFRKFTVTPATLRRGASRGFSPLQLGEWFTRRTGGQAPPAIEFLLAAMTSRLASLKAAKTVIVTLPSAKLLDGLIQHPATGPLLGERVGPFSVSVADLQLGPLQEALKQLGVELEVD